MFDGQGVLVGIGVSVGNGVGVFVGVGVDVAVAVCVGVAVFVGVKVGFSRTSAGRDAEELLANAVQAGNVNQIAARANKRKITISRMAARFHLPFFACFTFLEAVCISARFLF